MEGQRWREQGKAASFPVPGRKQEDGQLPLMPGPGLGTRLPGEAQPALQVGHHQATQGDGSCMSGYGKGLNWEGRWSRWVRVLLRTWHLRLPPSSSCPPSLEAYSGPHLTLPSFGAHPAPHYSPAQTTRA